MDDEELVTPISDKMIDRLLEKLREKLRSEDEYMVAEQILRRFLEGGPRSVRRFIRDLIEGGEDGFSPEGDKD